MIDTTYNVQWQIQGAHTRVGVSTEYLYSYFENEKYLYSSTGGLYSNLTLAMSKPILSAQLTTSVNV